MFSKLFSRKGKAEVQQVIPPPPMSRSHVSNTPVSRPSRAAFVRTPTVVSRYETESTYSAPTPIIYEASPVMADSSPRCDPSPSPSFDCSSSSGIDFGNSSSSDWS